MAEEKTSTVQYGVKMFVYIGAVFGILDSIAAIILILSAGTRPARSTRTSPS